MAEAWGYAIEFRKQRIPLREGLLTLGRSRQCEVPIADPSVSRQHVRLRIQAGEVVLEDLGSSNGTLVNGRRVEGQIELQDQDRIEMGDAVLRLFVEAPVEASQSAAMEAGSPLATVRMPTVDQALPRTPGDATFFLQSASVELAKQALSDSDDDDGDDNDHADSFFSPPPDLPAPDLSLDTQHVPEHSFADVFTPSAPPPAVKPAPAPTPHPPPPAAARARAMTDEIATEELIMRQPPGTSRSAPPAPLSADLRTMPIPVNAAAEEPSSALQFALEIPDPPPSVPPRSPATPARSDREKPPRDASRSSSRSHDILPSLDELEAAIGPQLPELPIARPATAEATATAQPLTPVGFWRRALAVVIDDIWILALSLAVAVAWGGPMSPQGQQIGSLFAAGIAVLVFWLGWGLWGTTPGKRALGLYVCTADGRPGIGLGRALIRLVGYLLSAILLGLGFLMVAFGSSKKALHDLLAGTYVGSR